ncbi:MAG: YggS family pyridoxal phosphate-dependent enzyme, partial [Thermoguttaceae bacterium]|nr:YggS family pyridoxal phosphate-dependent enzyme [Thermoguttaceae bacterium]MDW8037685.1 YggS family pyridoxal phosphate-dependent enzyme [Thermoguttaceae bacterium]
ARVLDRIAEAARRSGRSPEQIRLVAVTKYVGPEEIRLLVQAGCGLLGESRPQALWAKAAALSDLPVQWHLVGHLQRNKVARTLPLVQMIQSVDSLRLLEALNQQAAKLARPIPVLLEVNISSEPTKTGLPPQELEPILAQMPQFPYVQVHGLMTLAGLEGGLERARRDFAALRQLRDRLLPRCPEGVQLQELSMGMSGDFEVAIEEGATMVRIGTALFEGILPS